MGEQGDGAYGLQMVLKGKGILLGESTTLQQVVDHLGEPDDVSNPGATVAGGVILKYGKTELHFYDGMLFLAYEEADIPDEDVPVPVLSVNFSRKKR